MTEISSSHLPLRLSIDYGGAFDDVDVHQHEVRFCVVGAPDSQVIATVKSDPIIPPRVLRYRERGKFDLPLALLDEIIVISFSQLIQDMIQNEGAIDAVDIANGAEWLKQELSPRDAVIAISALSRWDRPRENIR